jgi:hypothetical protein
MKPDLTQRQSAFAAFADKAMPWHVKVKVRAAEKRQMHRAQKQALIKAVNERDLLLRLWKRWRVGLVDSALEGPYQKHIEKLIEFLESLTLKDEDRLVQVVRAGKWQQTHPDIRFLVLRLVDAKLVALREKAGLPPFDDGLPGDPPTTFQIIYNELR